MSSNPTKVPAIPRPPNDVSPEVRRYLESVQEALEIRLGRRGEPEDRAVTLRELIDSGLAKSLNSAPFDPNNISANNLGFSSSVVDALDSTIPPAVTNFTASGAYSVINLSWYVDHSLTFLAHAEIWRADTDDFGEAQFIDIATGSKYLDPVGGDQTKYYWIRFVSQAGVFGPFNDGDGTEASTATDVAHVLNVLNEAITSSELAQSLSAPIGNLPSDTAGAIATAEQKIDAIKNTPAWAADNDYVIGDLVTKDSNLYSALTDHTSTADNAPDTEDEIEDTTEWKHIGQYGSLIDVIAQTETTRATLSSDYLTTTDTNSAIATATTGLVSSTDLGSYVTTATLTSDYMTSTSTNSAIAAATTLLESEIGGTFEPGTTYDFTGSNTHGFTGIRATLTAGANYLTYEETSADASLNLVDAVGTIDGATDKIVRVKIKRVAGGSDWQGWLRYSHSGSTQVSFANQTTYVQISDPTTTDEWVIAEFDMTNAPGWDNTVDDLRFDFGNTGASEFHIEWIKIGATSKTLSAAIQTQQSSIDGVEANYTVKIDNNGSIAGFGLASTTSDSGNVTSDFMVAADKFSLMPSTDSAIADWANATAYVVGDQVKSNDNYWVCIQAHTSANAKKPHVAGGADYWNQTDKTPFSVLTSAQTVTVGDETVTIDPGVYIDAAYIKDADITAAKIGEINADSITSGTLDVTNRISASSIEASKILLDGTTMTSTTIVGGVNDGLTALKVGAISANAITSGTINAGRLNLGSGDEAMLTAGGTGNNVVQIKDLAVDTLQLADQAVTIPTGAYTAGQYEWSAAGYKDLQTITYSQTAVPIALFWSLTCKLSSWGDDDFETPATFHVRILRNNVELVTYDNLFPTFSTGGITRMAGATNIHTGSAGTVTYKLQAKGTGTSFRKARVTSRSMVTMELKK